MKYRKKQIVEIEAFQMTEAQRWDNSEWPEWLHQAWNMEIGEVGALWWDDLTCTLRIITLEGFQTVDWDDWIIQGIEGEIYPCKPGIFLQTYEEV